MLITKIRLKAFKNEDFKNLQEFADKFNLQILEDNSNLFILGEKDKCLSYEDTENILKNLYDEINKDEYKDAFNLVNIIAIHVDEDGFILKREVNEFGAVISSSPNWLLNYSVSDMKIIQNEAEHLHRKSALNCYIK